MRLPAACAAVTAGVLAIAGCAPPPPAPPAAPRHFLLVTIDTLRADRLGAYGYAAARTPTLDALAASGVRFDRAYSTAPITLTAHASLLSGRYPPAHGARHNGMPVSGTPPTLATALHDAGFATGAFVGAFPLDHRFGLHRGFDVYGDRLPRGADGRPANERTGQAVVDEAAAWLAQQSGRRTFAWVHLFEPHAPYGLPGDTRPVAERYDAEIAEADRQVGRLLAALGPARSETLIVLAADHGEAFGEHGEIGHSLFVYDTTLRVPLVLAGPGMAPRVIDSPVSLVDVAPTVLARLGVVAPESDGVDLSSALAGGAVPARALYAESFAPRFDFGWSALRAIRADGLKLIAAPRPELYDLAADPGETRDVASERTDAARRLTAQVEQRSPADLVAAAAPPSDATRRLQALGYLASAAKPAAGPRADPKDRRELAAQIARVTSEEVTGAALEPALRAILRSDPGNPQMETRLGFVLAGSNRCAEAERRFTTAIAAGMPSADPYLGLAGCLAARRRTAEALDVLARAEAIEPGNPVVLANRGVLLSDSGRAAEAIPVLEQAVAIDPAFLEARFNLAVALARTGQREAAASAAQALLGRMPESAPQRAEVLRLIQALR